MKKLLLLLSLLLSGNVFAGQNVTGDLYVSGNTGLGSTSPGAKLIVSSGNVGIGTPNPQKEFSLNGDIWIPNTSTGGTKGIIFKGSETFIHNFSPETTYSHNTFVGLNSGNFTMTGGAAFGNSSMNTGLGWMSLNSITTGRANLGLGSGGLRYVTSGDYNIGLNGGIGITTQSNNIMIGAFAGYFTVGGDNNVVVGNNTVPMSGSDNTVIGNMSFGSSLTDTTIGNTSLGSNSGLTIDNGNYNSFIGYNAGNYINAGDNNVCLGRDSCKYEDTGQTLNNSIAIGYNSRVNDTNAAAIGGTGADAVNVGIGTSIPNATLEVIKNGTKPYFMLSSAAITHGDIITVNSAGNTGIGNSSPTQKLDVTGIIRASSDIKVGSNSVCQSDGTNCAPVASGWSYVSPNIYPATLTDNVGVGTLSPDAELSITSTAANNLFRVNDNGPGDTSPFVINSSGNVGIYTAFPQRMLDIYQESGGSLLPTIYMHSDSTTGSPMVQFINSSASELFIRQLAPSSSGSFGSGNSEILSNTVTGNFVVGTIAATDLRLATNTSERMRIDSNGNVGISTIAPVALLEITQTAAQDALRVNDSSSPDSDPFIIDSTGNIGIGTIVTTTGLVTIDGGSGGVPIFTVKRGSGHGGVNGAVTLGVGSSLPQIGFDDVNGGTVIDWSLGYNVTGTRFSINKSSNIGGGGEKLVIDNNGNVGIGTFSPFGGGVIINNGNVGINSLTPGYLLDVNGAMRLTGTGASGSKHQDAANQACTTTCTTGRAMIGIDTATGKFVDPTDATADSCMCGG